MTTVIDIYLGGESTSDSNHTIRLLACRGTRGRSGPISVSRDTMSRDYMYLISYINLHQAPELYPSAP